MKNMAMVVSLAVSLLAVGCGGTTGGGSRNAYKYKAVSATGTFTLNSQLAGGCTASSSQAMTLSVGDYCSLSYWPHIGSFGGLLDLSYAQQAASGTNSCGAFYCSHPTDAATRSTTLALSEDLPDDPPENTQVTPVLKNLSATLGDCGAELALPDTLEAQPVTVGTFMTSEFTMIGAGQKNLSHSTLQGTTTGTLDYSFSIKFQLQPE